ncbi:ThuA domain-containing protein [Novosphingobium bradum]|uniref:ThuA domain-containing protein n=1 Tax=Novosphingobium bradum TaxID=1737444 RepID=A0ABV7IR97_9SPHN
MKRIGTLFAAAMAACLGIAQPATARAVTDCPLRDAPFSVDSPIIDILLSPQAKAVLDRATNSRFSKFPPGFMGTTPPTFAAILNLRVGAGFSGLKDDKLKAIDAELRAVPVTAADRIARCARYDNDTPKFQLPAGKPHVLVFEKINGFKDTPSVDAGHAALEAMAVRKGWALVFTDKGGAFNARTLGQFNAVIWNNVSGDALTLSQRRAFQRWMEQGGGFVGIHGSAGDPAWFWDWYADTLLGARFIGHPMNPQFQDARVVVETTDPKFAAAPREWVMSDEWYSFRKSARLNGATVIARLDESTYKPDGMMGQNLRMGDDHPIAWMRCVGKGRVFYSAIGHRPETYTNANNLALLEGGITAVMDKSGRCPAH